MIEFKSLKNIESSFRQIRLFGIVFVCVCAAVVVFALVKSYHFAEQQRQKVYVLDRGQSLVMALAQDIQQNRPIEARSHIRLFHETFFSLSPEKNAIETNINRALSLADRSATDYYNDLLEKGFFNRLIAAGITQMIQVDSIVCDFARYPIPVKTYARQRIVRESTITERSLITTCDLIDAVRSDNSPFGFLIERFHIEENKDIRTYERY